ncbi:MAG: hypothetical protein MK097_17920 [Dechloromonas sp.]|nr:hypothetical protein [Dechloromonas sp.]
MNMHAAPHDDLRLRGLGPAAMIGGGLVGLAGLAATVGIDGISGSTIFWKSWLFGFMLTQAICLGALFFVILQRSTAGRGDRSQPSMDMASFRSNSCSGLERKGCSALSVV